MDSEHNFSSHESARAPQSHVYTNPGHDLQSRLQIAANTPPPMHGDDNHVGDSGSSGFGLRGRFCPPNSRRDSGASSESFPPRVRSDSPNGPTSNIQELDQNSSAHSGKDHQESALSVDQVVGTSESQNRSDGVLADFVGNDFGSVAPSRKTRASRGKSSGLVNEQKIGKTVKASPTKTSPIKNTLSGKKKGPHNLLKELMSHNEDAKKPTREDVSSPLFDTSFVKLTRANSRALHIAKQDKLPSPRRSYNEKELMEEQMQKVRGRKTYYPTNEQTPHEISSPRNTSTGAAMTTPDAEAQKTTVQPRKTSGQEAVDKLKDMQATMALEEWDKWDTRKDQITDLLRKDRYTVSAGPQAPHALTLGEVPDGFNHFMDKGLHVFSPTADVFNDFTTFLEVVEAIAGREHGVVKVVVPNECLKPRNKPDYATLNQEVRMKLNTCVTRLELRKSRATTTAVYNVVMPHVPDLPASAWRSAIQQKRQQLLHNLGAAGVGVKDIWMAANRFDVYDEKAMIEVNQQWPNHVFYAPGIAATDELRDCLRCGNPKLNAYPGNALSESESVEAGVNTSVFHVSATDSTVSGMQVVNFGAYLLNFLHDGAPRVWTIARPQEHKKFEEMLHSFLQPIIAKGKRTGMEIPRPKLPPACDNFLKHKPLYIPDETLKSYDIKHTKVAQYLGEMVIAFPFAYHQVYNTGANIAESIAYATDRWKIFHANKLFKHCDQKCSPEAVSPDFDLGFIPSSPPDQAVSSPGHPDSSPGLLVCALPSGSATRSSERKQPDKRSKSKNGKADRTSIDGKRDDSISDHNPTEKSSQGLKRAETKSTYQDTASDNAAEVESLKHKIQDLMEENTRLKKLART